jgi:hypothetical protein
VVSAVRVVTPAQLALRQLQAPVPPATPAARVLRARQRPVVTVVSAVLEQAAPLPTAALVVPVARPVASRLVARVVLAV